MLLSVDWDAFSGTRELVFDAPIWGTPDQDHDRLDAWRTRARRRAGQRVTPAVSWADLEPDFPLYPGWETLTRYAGVPAFITLSHADAWGWLEQFPGHDILNLDSHHDLSSFSGDRARLRPGNWAGLALEAGLVGSYTCQYPEWHADLPVAEGHDLERTRSELGDLLSPAVLDRVTLARGGRLPEPAEVRSVLLVQSPAWTSPAHDGALWTLAATLGAQALCPALDRRQSVP
ncbi:arginase [Deinococcus navajonensis]|uniref:Arginase n=1 Tax=Deinococcus navajonensis TaxID=309884 RepID=A0ABV8XM22_9DEIO